MFSIGHQYVFEEIINVGMHRRRNIRTPAQNERPPFIAKKQLKSEEYLAKAKAKSVGAAIVAAHRRNGGEERRKLAATAAWAWRMRGSSA